MARNRTIAAIHTAKRQLGLDDDAYRDVLERVAGKRSAAELDERGREAVLTEFRRLGFGTASRTRGQDRPKAKGAHAGKARALWLCLWQLGEVNEPSERAFDAFAKGITGVETMAWSDPQQRSKVIEGLKSWCARVGYAPKPGLDTAGYQDALMAAQWHRLYELGAFGERGLHASLQTWLRREAGVTGARFLTPEQFERCARELRRWIERLKAKVGAAEHG